MRRSLRVMVVLAAAAIATSLGAADMKRPARPGLAPHRDGNVAIAEELAAARRAGTVASYDLFLARHPTHELARTARAERAHLLRRRPRSQ